MKSATCWEHSVINPCEDVGKEIGWNQSYTQKNRFQEKILGRAKWENWSVHSPFSFWFGSKQIRKERLVEEETHRGQKPKSCSVQYKCHLSHGYFVTEHLLQRKLVKFNHMIVVFFPRNPFWEIQWSPGPTASILGVRRPFSDHQGAERNPPLTAGLGTSASIECCHLHSLAKVPHHSSCHQGHSQAPSPTKPPECRGWLWASRCQETFLL